MIKTMQFPLIHGNDFASVIVIDEWLIKGVMPKADVGMIFGESGSGKSFLALDMAMSIAQGVSWRDCNVTKGSVAYLVAEGTQGFRKRLKAYAKKNKVKLADIPFYVIDECPNFLGKSDDDQKIINNIHNHNAVNPNEKIKVLFIDTFAMVTSGANENSSDDMGAVIGRCKRIALQTGAMVVLIHHSGKDATKGARGWSGVKGAMDFEIEITRKDDLRTAKLSKMKDGEDGEMFGFTLEIVVLEENEFGVPEVTSCVIAPSEIPDVKRSPKGDVQKTVFKEIERLNVIVGGLPISEQRLIDSLMMILPVKEGVGRDRRKETVKEAIKGLVNGSFITIKDDLIDLHPNIQKCQKH